MTNEGGLVSKVRQRESAGAAMQTRATATETDTAACEQNTHDPEAEAVLDKIDTALRARKLFKVVPDNRAAWLAAIAGLRAGGATTGKLILFAERVPNLTIYDNDSIAEGFALMYRKHGEVVLRKGL